MQDDFVFDYTVLSLPQMRLAWESINQMSVLSFIITCA